MEPLPAMNAVTRALLDSEDWRSARASTGTAAHVPVALEGLIGSQDEEAALEWYWRIDNTVVVQARVFESAVLVAPVLLTALQSALSEPTRFWLLELAMQLLGDEVHEAEPDASVRERTRASFGAGLWVIYAQLMNESPRVRATAAEVAYLIEGCSAESAAFIANILQSDQTPEVRAAILALPEHRS